MTNDLTIPVFLRRKPGDKRKAAPAPTLHIDHAKKQRDDELLAQLTPPARADFEAELQTGRARIHWLEDASTVSAWEAKVLVRREASKLDPETRERLRSLRKAKRPQRPSDTFTLAELAAERKVEPRVYRGAARNIKGALVPLQVNGLKYVFHNGDKQRIADFIQQELDRCKSKTSSASRSQASAPASLPSKSKAIAKSKVRKATSSARSASKTGKGKKRSSPSQSPKRRGRKS